MADIRPFCAIRPTKGLECKIAALPYDVYNREEAKKVVAANPMSFLAIDRAETQFSDEVDTYADCVYEKAAGMLSDQIRQGKFNKDDAPCFYLYELEMDHRVQTGIVACASIDDYMNQVIKKHENTRADKELDRIRHVDTCNTQTGPIFLAYRHKQELKDLIHRVKKQAPECEFTTEDQITHRVYVVRESWMIESISKTFGYMEQIYIADGHHRCASAVKVGLRRREENPSYTGEEEFNFFLSVLFSDDELMIMDYNRVVKDLNGLSQEEFLTRIAEKFDISLYGDTPYQPEKKGSFGMYLNHKWWKLNAKEALFGESPVEQLDVSVLQNHLLAPILGIKDPKTDKRIDFIGGIRGLKELERRVNTDMMVAFSMYPTSMKELFDVADAGLLMPPKSTWFEPKLRSGLFLHSLA